MYDHVLTNKQHYIKAEKALKEAETYAYTDKAIAQNWAAIAQTHALLAAVPDAVARQADDFLDYKQSKAAQESQA